MVKRVQPSGYLKFVVKVVVSKQRSINSMTNFNAWPTYFPIRNSVQLMHIVAIYVREVRRCSETR